MATFPVETLPAMYISKTPLEVPKTQVIHARYKLTEINSKQHEIGTLSLEMEKQMIPCLIGETEPSTAQFRFFERTLLYTRRCESTFMRTTFFEENSTSMKHLAKKLEK